MIALALAALLAASLQDTVDRAMAGHPGVAAVLDLHSGRLLAVSQAATAAHRPVKPGSTIKPFVLAALLESGRFDPARRVFCPTRLRLGAHRMDCVHPAVPEGFTASTALAYSCNYYFAQAARALSVEELSAALRRHGFTVQTPEDPALLALGESGVLITPLDLLAAYRRLALRRPEAKLAPLFQGLLDCTTFGTGRLAAPVGLAVAGKTGSSGHAWFIGWPTGRRPANVVLVFLERGSGLGGVEIDADQAHHRHPRRTGTQAQLPAASQPDCGIETRRVDVRRAKGLCERGVREAVVGAQGDTPAYSIGHIPVGTPTRASNQRAAPPADKRPASANAEGQTCAFLEHQIGHAGQVVCPGVK